MQHQKEPVTTYSADKTCLLVGGGSQCRRPEAERQRLPMRGADRPLCCWASMVRQPSLPILLSRQPSDSQDDVQHLAVDAWAAVLLLDDPMDTCSTSHRLEAPYMTVVLKVPSNQVLYWWAAVGHRASVSKIVWQARYCH